MSYTVINSDKRFNRVYTYRVWTQDHVTGSISEAFFTDKQRAEQYKRFMEACGGCSVSMNVWTWETYIER